jgi:TPP-dependent pyruvate/acetoin dehydrogenase alpha subunit
VLDCVNRGLVIGGPHLSVGQEAVAVGVVSALRPGDYFTTTHRGHGHCIARGADMPAMMAELFAKGTGLCKGKAGSMHIADFSLGIIGANGIVGAGIPIAAGAGLAARVLGGDWIGLSFFGDGAANEGSFHEALNLAGLWKLPVVFVCENNCFGMFTPMACSTPVSDICIRAQGYGMPGVAVDGNDVVAVYETAKAAVDRARCGDGPTLIEAKTYRHLDHYAGDKGRYRDKKEVAQWMALDPIPCLRKTLVDNQVLTDELEQQLLAQIRQEVDAAVDFAISSPEPDMSELLTDMYVPFKPV